MTAPSPADTPPISASETGEFLTPIEARYVWVIRASLAINMVIFSALVGVGDYFLAPRIGFHQWLTTALVFAALLTLLIVFPIRRVASIRYHISEDHIRIRRGFLFTVDTIVPFVRVQHIDVSQGPIERSLGLASLSVYTSGTLNQVVTLPGLETGLANAMRETIHRHILTDFE